MSLLDDITHYDTEENRVNEYGENDEETNEYDDDEYEEKEIIEYDNTEIEANEYGDTENEIKEYADDEYGENKPSEQRDVKLNRAHIENMVQKYKRLVIGSVDPENIARYQAKLDEWQRKLSQGIANSENGGIINTNIEETTDKDVHYIGKINKEIYSCVTNDIVTDEVIITDERIEHIQTNHPNDFEQYFKRLIQAITEPEYIIEANKPNTALVLKSFRSDDKVFKTILRLITSSDNPDFKNSVITFMKIDEKEWKRLIKNKKILYKSE